MADKRKRKKRRKALIRGAKPSPWAPRPLIPPARWLAKAAEARQSGFPMKARTYISGARKVRGKLGKLLP